MMYLLHLELNTLSFKVSEDFLVVKQFLDTEGRNVIYAKKDKLKLKIIFINHPSAKAVSGFNRTYNEIIHKKKS